MTDLANIFLISLNFPCLVYYGVSLCPFVLVVLWLGLCAEVAVEGISRIRIFFFLPPPFLPRGRFFRPNPKFSFQHK